MNVKLKLVHALSVDRSVFVHVALGGACLLKMAVSRFFIHVYKSKVRRRN